MIENSIIPEPPLPEETWSIDKLISVIRKSATEYGRTYAPAVQVTFTHTPVEGDGPVAIDLDNQRVLDEEVRWIVRLSIEMIDGLPLSDENLTRKTKTIEADGSTLTDAYRSLLNLFECQIRIEMEDLRLQTLHLQEAIKTLGGGC